MKYFLSIDYGGTNIKAIVFDEEGRQGCSARRSCH